MQESTDLDLNPQLAQMADESMVRNLAAQAAAIWPQEAPFFAAYALPEAPQILDVGCGTGEITWRLAELFPQARVTGIDIIHEHLAWAQQTHARFGDRLIFRPGDAFHLDFPDASFDLVVNRHMVQSVPRPERVLAELVRVTRPGGRIHVVAEDYGMMHMHPTEPDSDEFFEGPVMDYAKATQVDLRIGRGCHAHLVDLGLENIAVHYVVIDTLRVDREIFARILEAWRDGYTAPIAEHSGESEETVRRRFTAIIDCIHNPRGYAVWQLPVWSATRPQK